MRHGIAGKKFGRNQTLRHATLRDLARAIFKCDQIKTTRTKAMEARKLIERLVTLGKKNTLDAKRRAYAVLCDHVMVSNLFNVIAPRFAARKGGYTRVIKFTTNRQGDNAQMVLLELTERAPEKDVAAVVDAEVVKADEKKASKPKAEKNPAVKKAVVKKATAK